MANSKAEDPSNEIELPEYESPQHEPTDSHREEDQTPLVKYSSTSRTLTAPDSDVPPKKEVSRWWGLLVILIYAGIIVGISGGIIVLIFLFA